MLRVILHFLIFVILTVLTQIGGLIYLFSFFIISSKSNLKLIKRIGLFVVLYSVCTFLIVPFIAPLFGREKIEETEFLKAHSFVYKLANRNYVKPELNKTLQSISKELENRHNGIEMVYLDANFPFIDGFPLLPHLSHKDGKKIDVSFIYEDGGKKLSNLKPSNSGYGVYVQPKRGEVNQTESCLSKGYWQYDYPKYLTFGINNKDIQFSEQGTKALMNKIVTHQSVQKVFIEPHLKSRLGLTNSKIRFHGCRAVRHDDHIHFQIN